MGRITREIESRQKEGRNQYTKEGCFAGEQPKTKTETLTNAGLSRKTAAEAEKLAEKLDDDKSRRCPTGGRSFIICVGRAV